MRANARIRTVARPSGARHRGVAMRNIRTAHVVAKGVRERRGIQEAS
jgi:hypothetical protein